MKNFVSSNILLGCLIAFILGLLTLVPIVNLFVWILALGMYIWLANRIVVTGRESLETGESPNMAAMGWSALTGFIAGLVGAVVASGFHLLMLHIFPHYNLLQARPALRSLFAFRFIVILVVYPIVGILVCGFAGLMFGNDLHRASRADQAG